MDVPVRSPRQPSLDRRGLVGGVVVHDDVDVQPLGDAPVDLLQEVEELPGPVASRIRIHFSLSTLVTWHRNKVHCKVVISHRVPAYP